MTPFETALAALGVDAVVGFDRAVALERGFSTKQASDWQRVHDAYFAVGCDAVETNTFGCNLSNLGDYNIVDRIG